MSTWDITSPGQLAEQMRRENRKGAAARRAIKRIADGQKAKRLSTETLAPIGLLNPFDQPRHGGAYGKAK